MFSPDPSYQRVAAVARLSRKSHRTVPNDVEGGRGRSLRALATDVDDTKRIKLRVALERLDDDDVPVAPNQKHDENSDTYKSRLSKVKIYTSVDLGTDLDYLFRKDARAEISGVQISPSGRWLAIRHKAACIVYDIKVLYSLLLPPV